MRQLIVLTVILLSASSAFGVTILSENFDNVAGLGGAGWVFSHNSSPIGTTGWFQGNPGVFPSQAGAANSYIAANFENADFGGNISTWLLTPELALNNGDTLSFYTRSSGFLADRLEVRYSTSGASADVGATDASVGVFTNLLLTINPALFFDGYPSAWTQFSLNVNGLPGATSGRYAFRYFVTDTSVNADYIGIDTVRVNSTPATVPEPGILSGLSLGLAALLFVRRAHKR